MENTRNQLITLATQSPNEWVSNEFGSASYNPGDNTVGIYHANENRDEGQCGGECDEYVAPQYNPELISVVVNGEVLFVNPASLRYVARLVDAQDAKVIDHEVDGMLRFEAIATRRGVLTKRVRGFGRTRRDAIYNLLSTHSGDDVQV